MQGAQHLQNAASIHRATLAALALVTTILFTTAAHAEDIRCRGKHDCGPFSECSVDALGECGSSGMLSVCSGRCVAGATWRSVVRAGLASQFEPIAFAPNLALEIMPPVLEGALGVDVGWWIGHQAHAGVNLSAQVVPEDLRMGIGVAANTDDFGQVGYRAFGRATWSGWSLLQGLTPARFVSLTFEAGASTFEIDGAPSPFVALAVDLWL